MEAAGNASVTRRAFVAASGLAAGAAVLGARPAAAQTAETADADAEARAAFEAEARAIDPVEPPAAWDAQADVVVVGSGAGGMVGALRLAELGYKVILLEKDGLVGGASRYAGHFVNFGGHKMSESYQWALPSYPYEPRKVVEYLNDMWGMSANPHLLLAMATEGPKCIDWMEDALGVPWEPLLDAGMGSGNIHFAGQITPNNSIMINDYFFTFLAEKAREAGVDIRLNTAAAALVRDGETVVGVKAAGEDGTETWLRGDKAVLLTAGGFEMNRAMLKKYLPSIYEGLANVPCPPCNTGECIRMGIGVGADIAGRDSSGSYDGGVEWQEYGEYDTRMTFHVNKDGNQVLRQPWLRFNRMGERVPWLTSFGQNFPYSIQSETGNVTALTDGATVEITQPGGRVYVCFDSTYEQTLTSGAFKEAICRAIKVVPEDDPLIDRVPEYQRDWRTGFQYMLDAGAVKKCDTLEELEEALGLREGVLTEQVAKWNAACEAGEDYADIYPYDPSWLIPITEPPFYGAKLGGNIFTTKCGLRVNPDMQVVDTAGSPIPGLYAGFHTAGGSNGECNISGRPFAGMYGDVGTSFVGGYMAANGIARADGKVDA